MIFALSLPFEKSRTTFPCFPYRCFISIAWLSFIMALKSSPFWISLSSVSSVIDSSELALFSSNVRSWISCLLPSEYVSFRVEFFSSSDWKVFLDGISVPLSSLVTSCSFLRVFGSVNFKSVWPSGLANFDNSSSSKLSSSSLASSSPSSLRSQKSLDDVVDDFAENLFFEGRVILLWDSIWSSLLLLFPLVLSISSTRGLLVFISDPIKIYTMNKQN